ncbi:transmembrane protein 53 isoform X2 [Fopius arisanus]|uniref:Transmembrane protein 53 isoform X2 n=1 Tax=Fopius arisanus TaxID=64838 RepID=A0A9R1TW97_9HYME|nr:PREDICTED: transmembrane protein 53 isoform X2 [Fopius arisanus]
MDFRQSIDVLAYVCRRSLLNENGEWRTLRRRPGVCFPVEITEAFGVDAPGAGGNLGNSQHKAGVDLSGLEELNCPLTPGTMADKIDLDLHLMFPSMPPVSDQQRDEFVFVYEDDKRPVVILLGWAGCQDKYLAKYSAIYEERSCITLRCIAPVEWLLWRRDKILIIGRQLLQVILDRSLDQHPIFFHIFSNGGAILYQQISVAMQGMGNPINVKGVIFDSSPGERRVSSLFRAVSAIVGGHPVTNLPMSLFITIFLSVFWLYEIITRAWGRGHTIPTSPFELTEEPHSWPQLFLYSNADTLIPAIDVEKFGSRRAERGVRVQLVLFTDAPHVKLYAVYPDVYVNTVCTFIHECIMNKENQLNSQDSMEDEEGIQLKFQDTISGLTKRIVMPQETTQSPLDK